MAEDIKDVVDFSRLKECIVKCRTTSKYVAEAVGLPQVRVSRIITGWDNPKTDVIARLAWALKVPVSEIIEFKGIVPNKNQKEWLEGHERKYRPADDAVGELTYAPLWELIDGYLEKANEGKTEGLKTANDLFDSIEPYRRKNNLVSGLGEEAVKRSLEARGITEPSKRERHYEAKGLTPETRTKLRKDRPLSIRMIYDICFKLGCSVDWVMSYK